MCIFHGLFCHSTKNCRAIRAMTFERDFTMCCCWVWCHYNEVNFLENLNNKIWWLCLVPTSTTRLSRDVGYRMAKKCIGLYKELIFMDNDIKFLEIEWRTPYPLTNFEGRFGLHALVIILDSNMCGFLFIWTLARSQTLVVNWQN